MSSAWSKNVYHAVSGPARNRRSTRGLTVRAAIAVIVAGLLSTTGGAQPSPDQRDIGVLSGLAPGPINVVVIGDFGEEDGNSLVGSKAVFEAIRARHERVGQAYAFGITVGDNFYPSGVPSRERLDERWKATGYDSLKIPFYATLGNHDYRGSIEAQVVKDGSTWRMPFTYYTFATPSARFFALDTDEGTTGVRNPFLLFGLFPRSWSRAQRAWLDAALAANADATWKIVYGHHPIYSDGEHGDTKRLLKPDGLRQVLRDRQVDLYIAGHDHDLQYFAPGPEDGRMHFIVAGGGGRELRPIAPKRAAFARSTFGFSELVIDGNTLTMRILGSDGKVLHEAAPLTK